MTRGGLVRRRATGMVALALIGVAGAACVPVRPPAQPAAHVAHRARVWDVVELAFRGPYQRTTDTPARDVTLVATFVHEGGATIVQHGFFDGDGRGAPTGDVFRVRFTPTATGRWTLTDVTSSEPLLAGQREGDVVVARRAAPRDPGFWLVDEQRNRGRWFVRSDGSHPYLVGNTHYTFLSRRRADGSQLTTTAADDIRAQAPYFNKVRFGLTGDRYPDPGLRPFLDDAGQPTEDGNFSARPNPSWFHQRVDPAVAAGEAHDVVTDLILAGPDIATARATLAAGANGGDNTPWLRYIAARYGAYPNVWMCLANEWDIKTPRYTAEQVRRWGATLQTLLPYPTPVSAHNGDNSVWNPQLVTDPPWYSHTTNQWKIRTLSGAADVQRVNRAVAGERVPSINDEVAYQGAGDQFSEGDVVEAFVGALAGGGYASTGYKPAPKVGQYTWGGFDAGEHSAADNLRWLRTKVVDRHLRLPELAPADLGTTIFDDAPASSRALVAPDRQYVLASSEPGTVRVALPPGRWRVDTFDVMAMTHARVARAATGSVTVDVEGRATLLVVTRGR